MSDYRDIEKEAREKGILLDKCGLIDRYYDFGSYQDFCGMTPQEILDNMRKAGQGGGGSQKTTVSITATVVENGADWVVKAVSNTVLPDQVTITVLIDNEESRTITMAAGSLEETSTWTIDKYATVSATVTPSSTETTNYKVTITNPNGDGMKNISVKTYKDGQETEVETISAKVGSNVEINIDELVDCDFDNWEVNGVTGETKPLEFVMPDVDNLEVNIYYEIKTFTVRFLNWDGSIIETETVKYNTTPSYSGEEPTKPEDEQFTYKFDGWDKPFAPITEDTDYTAVFTETLRTYQIRFLNYNGEVLQSSEIAYGTTPVYQGTTPTKESNPQYDYTFNGWEPEITVVTGDAEYTAVFNEILRQYTITWIISGESEEETLDYGTMPTHADPESAHTPEYDYTFSAWTPEIVPVEGNATYTAVFTETLNSYPISVDHFDPEIVNVTVSGEPYVATDVYPYGSQVTVRAEIKDEYKAQYHFVSFDDVWETTKEITENNSVSVPSIASDEYLITWKNEKTELYHEWVAYGETPEYSGETPTKESSAQYNYTFSGWTPEIVPVTEDATYSAEFSETLRSYPISISGLSEDVHVTVNGLPYSAETEYEYGTNVTIVAEIVNKPEYHFEGGDDTWESGVTILDETTVALPAIVKDTYTITWYNDTPYRRYYNWTDTHTYDGTYLTKEDLWYDDGVTARPANNQDIVKDEHGDPILDEYGKYVYNEYCTRCWKGAFYAPGATFPWCVVELDSPFDGTIKFTYKEGTPDEKIVYPWGEHVVARPNGYGCASIPEELSMPELKVNFSGEPHFNKSDLHVTLIDEYGVESDANWSLIQDETSWLEANGIIYQEEVAYGETPEYSGATPTKESDIEYDYTFSAWTPEIVPVTEDAGYTAVFSKTVKQYTVTLSGDPLQVTLSGTGTYDYGTVVEISATPVGEYVFDRWSDDVTANTRQITVTGNVTLTAYAKEPTAALAYWGKVPVSGFDTLGNTFSSSDLTQLFITPYEGGDQGSEVGYGDEAKTAITYEYVITSADEEAQSAYEEDYEPEPLYDYVMGNSMYYIYAIPSEYLSDATLSITDDYSSSWPTSSANTYVIDGVNYTIYKFIADHTPIGDDPNYSIPETYFSVLDSPEYTEGYSYRRPTNFVLNKNV